MKASLKHSFFTTILFGTLMSEAIAVDYTITKIADNLPGSGIFSFPDSNAAINNNGVVTYKSESTDDGPQFIYTSASATPIASCSDMIFDSAPEINDSDTVIVSFSGEDGSGTPGVHTPGVYDCTSSSHIVDTSNTSFSDFGDASINASGGISFIGDNSVNTFSPLNTVDDDSGANDSFLLTDINDSGTVMYIADVGSDQAVYDSTSATAIFTAANIPSGAINNSGTVVYTDKSDVYLGATAIPLAMTFTTVEDVAINNNGTVAISGAASGASAIYTYDGTTLEKVIDSNDYIDGSVIGPGPAGHFIGGIVMGSESINDAGEIVFWATMVDTSTFTLYDAIFVATPVQTFLLGDINEDGVVDTADYVLLSGFVLGTTMPTATELTAGDMNTDGSLNAADLILHVRTVLGEI